MQGQRKLISRPLSQTVRPCSRSRLPSTLAPVTSSRGSLRIVAHGSKDDLENQLDLTQQTLDRVLAAVQAAQTNQNNQQSAMGGVPGLQDSSVLAAREQQLWERQQALLDRMQQQWDNERQAWMQREQSLLAEVATLRQEMRQLLSLQTQQQQQLAPPRPAAAAAAAPDAASFAGPGAAAGSSGSSSSVDPAASNSPAAAVISGPSSASAAVAEAIRAVRDAHANPPAASSMEDTSPGAWENLFGGSSGSSSAAADSVAAAIAAVDDTDVLLNMDLSFGGSSSSRGRRRVAFDAASSSSSSDEGSIDRQISSISSSSTASSALNPAAAEAAVSDSVSNTESNAALIEVQKGDPAGPPPLLNLGDDDIFWVSKLHSGLMAAGFYPSDEEVENWFFGEATQGALLMFQACNDVAETGTTCDASWRKLLGEAEYLAAHAASSSSSSNPAAAAEAGSAQGQEVITYSFSSSSSSSKGSSSWPVLLEMDGGREVHALQVALGRQGYHCGDDEMRWWQFGSSTLDALKTFQACNGLPESGATDERTWLALLGPEATPDQLQELRGEESSYEEDLAEPEAGAVWLLGEQRWSRPVNGTS
ncbi:hypothetical protein OEZ86_010425 [Tetradesmus obliquus]|nr:hypothetical protein OEZ86_010425 [Tetradesmus obliquus]